MTVSGEYKASWWERVFSRSRDGFWRLQGFLVGESFVLRIRKTKVRFGVVEDRMKEFSLSDTE